MSTDSLTASSTQKPGEFTLRARLLHKLADSVDRSNPGIHDERCSVRHRPPYYWYVNLAGLIIQAH